MLLDSNAEAEGHDFFSLGGFSLSDDDHLLAWSVDTVGDERYTIQVKDLRTGELLPDTVTGTSGGVTWSADATHLFYTTVDDAWRPYRVWRHQLGATERRHARPRGEGRTVLHRRGAHPVRALPRHRLVLEDHERGAGARGRRSDRRVPGGLAARDRRRVLPRARAARRAGRLPADAQPRRAQFRAGRRPGRRSLRQVAPCSSVTATTSGWRTSTCSRGRSSSPTAATPSPASRSSCSTTTRRTASASRTRSTSARSCSPRCRRQRRVGPAARAGRLRLVRHTGDRLRLCRRHR